MLDAVLRGAAERGRTWGDCSSVMTGVDVRKKKHWPKITAFNLEGNGWAHGKSLEWRVSHLVRPALVNGSEGENWLEGFSACKTRLQYILQ